MNKICWKGRAFKALSFGKNSKKAGRNFSGSITIFHRGGGSKKLLRRIDFQRKYLARGFIERIEYDPNRTARIALVRWSNIKLNDSVDKYVGAPKCSPYGGGRPFGKGALALKSPSRIDFSSGGYFSAPYYHGPWGDPLSNLQHNDGQRSRGSLDPNGMFSAAKVVGLARLQQRSACSRLKAPRRLFAVGKINNSLLSYSQIEQNVMYSSVLAQRNTKLAGQEANVEAKELALDREGESKEHELQCSKEDQVKKDNIESMLGSQPKGVVPLKPSFAVDREPLGVRAFSYILASEELRPGDEVLNIDTGPTRFACNRKGYNVKNLLSPTATGASGAPASVGGPPSRSEVHPIGGGRARMSSQTKKLSQLSDPNLSIQEGLDFLKRLTKDPATIGPLDNVDHVNQKSGISLPLWLAPIGSVIHNIELYPGGGGKLARAAGTSAQLVQKPLPPVAASNFHQRVPFEKYGIEGTSETPSSGRPFEGAPKERSTKPNHTEDNILLTQGSLLPEGMSYPLAGIETEQSNDSFLRRSSLCTIRLPSGRRQLLDLRCRATIGSVSNIDHRARMLTKAGHSRWLGFRPVVRGVAMNPIDHPHGGGEGRTKGGRPSVSPWGKPAKRARHAKSSSRGAPSPK